MVLLLCDISVDSNLRLRDTMASTLNYANRSIKITDTYYVIWYLKAIDKK